MRCLDSEYAHIAGAADAAGPLACATTQRARDQRLRARVAFYIDEIRRTGARADRALRESAVSAMATLVRHAGVY